MNKELLEYFSGDELAADVWQSKYQVKDNSNTPMENTPLDMHKRLSREFGRIEYAYTRTEKEVTNLSEFGTALYKARKEQSIDEIRTEILGYFDKFKYIVPQGSIMSILGHPYKVGALSNCFVIPPPADSYGGILRTDEHLVQLMKRRGGVGTNLNTLRPNKTVVSNAAGSSTGAPSFMHRYSNSTREVAQDGRRGALMLLLHCLHPDIFDFVKIKKDRTKVTGANISTMLTDKFLQAAKADADFMCKFPIDDPAWSDWIPEAMSYNKLLEVDKGKWIMKIHAKELLDLIFEMAWENAEPGVAFIDRIINFSPEGVYEMYKAIASNPCFHPDTLIETVNGRVKIKDILESTLVYSKDENGKLCIRRCTNSFVTKKNAKTLKITLRNGSNIQVTPDHKMFVHERGWIETKNLSEGDRIAHLSRSRRGAAYSGVYLTTDPEGKNGQVMEHRLVTGVTDPKLDVHHMSRNTYDNKLSNLLVLPHEKHSVVTAIEDNPQNHQIYGERNRFISGPNSRKGRKTIVPVPDHLKTKLKNKSSNCVVSIEVGDTTDVYDIQVEGTHNLIANNMVAHNCGEQWLQAYDSCRLMALNLFSIVDNPFTGKAKINYDKLYEISYMQQRFADDLVDLEIEHVKKIIAKIVADPEPEEVKRTELELWQNILKTAQAGRRTGCGFTGMADMLAALNLKYDSEAAIDVITNVCKTKMRAELDCTIDLVILRDPFDGWDVLKEFTDEGMIGNGVKGCNDFYQMLLEEFHPQVIRMGKYGRRNVSWSTVAPTGTVSIMTQTSSGLEPIFLPYYMRRKKINPSDEGSHVDFTDASGDKWQEFAVLHPKFSDWIISQGIDIRGATKEVYQSLFEKSPWFGSTANDIDWEKRVLIQSVIQRYTTNAISSTINLPNDVTKEEVAKIYWRAWELGLKGVTVYRDGCRTGVLVSNEVTTKEVAFSQKDATKRPKSLDCKVHTAKVKGVTYTIIVSTLEDHPYEVFVLPDYDVSFSKGFVIKEKKGFYNLLNDKNEVKHTNIGNYVTEEEAAIARLVSTSLRHGVAVTHIVNQLNKTEGNMVGFSKAISRTLKHFIKEGTTSKEECPECHQTTMVYEEGCKKCLNCGHSRC